MIVTPLCDLLGIRVPIILAGMAGGSTTPELVAAVSEAGGLGTFGANGMSADALAAAVRRARTLTTRPVAVNVLLAGPTAPSGDLGALGDAIGGYRRELDLPAPPPSPAPATAAELVRAGLDEGAAVISIGLGDPSPIAEMVARAGVPLIAMAATVADARTAVASGANVIVAQGAEAGGHRSNFTLPDQGPLPMVGLMALVPRIVAEVGVPVVAAGGVADGRGMAAALALGAQGVQVGTRFLLAEESGTSAAYRDRIRATADTDTVVTTALSGRPARGVRNRVVSDLEAIGSPSLGYPRQAAGWADVRREAESRGDAELLSLWCGQAAAVAADEIPAGEIVRQMMAEAEAVIAALAG